MLQLGLEARLAGGDQARRRAKPGERGARGLDQIRDRARAAARADREERVRSEVAEERRAFGEALLGARVEDADDLGARAQRAAAGPRERVGAGDAEDEAQDGVVGQRRASASPGRPSFTARAAATNAS